MKPWRVAREIIDWGLKGQSIFNRKRPLAEGTVRRIAAGLRKFGGDAAEPFLVMLYGTNDARSINRPLPTVTAGGNHMALVEPFLVKYHGDHRGKDDSLRRVHSVEKPIPTLDTSNRFGLVEPFITIMKGQSKVRGLNKPLPTITTNPHLYLCEPFIVKYYGQGSGVKAIDKPLPTLTTKDRFGLVEPCQLDILFRMLQYHELAAAMSFDKSYQFMGTKADITKQIGNAVPVKTAAALCKQLLV